MLYFDIETTGLSREKNKVYLIGVLEKEKDFREVRQYFASDAGQEAVILEQFEGLLGTHKEIISYNGKRFDGPFLNARAGREIFTGQSHEDLYLTLAPLKKMLSLMDLKQESLERFLLLDARKYPNGKECLKIYKEYGLHPADDLKEQLLGHNREDLYGLAAIECMKNYLNLLNGSYEITRCQRDGSCLRLTLRLEAALPRAFSYRCEDFYASFEGCGGAVSLKMKDLRLRRYYKDFKNYKYHILEDTLIPKAISRFMDPSLFKKADHENCYTWISFQESFSDHPQMLQPVLSSYFEHEF